MRLQFAEQYERAAEQKMHISGHHSTLSLSQCLCMFNVYQEHKSICPRRDILRRIDSLHCTDHNSHGYATYVHRML